MRKSSLTGLCAAIVGLATAGVMAQTQAPAPQTSPAGAEKKITVTGCLREAPAVASNAPAADEARAPGAAPGAVGTSGSAAAAKFILENATASAPDSAASPAPGAPASAAASQTYHLIANPAALTPHVGKKLELTGTLDESAAASAQAAPGAPGPMLKVEAGKIMADSCSK